jgi:hypothetical protein
VLNLLIFASWEMFILTDSGDWRVFPPFRACSLSTRVGEGAHVCKSRGHDVDMHGMASAFGI